MTRQTVSLEDIKELLRMLFAAEYKSRKLVNTLTDQSYLLDQLKKKETKTSKQYRNLRKHFFKYLIGCHTATIIALIVVLLLNNC